VKTGVLELGLWGGGGGRGGGENSMRDNGALRGGVVKLNSYVSVPCGGVLGVVKKGLCGSGWRGEPGRTSGCMAVSWPQR